MPKEGIQRLDSDNMVKASFLVRNSSEVMATKQFKIFLNFFGTQK